MLTCVASNPKIKCKGTQNIVLVKHICYNIGGGLERVRWGEGEGVDRKCITEIASEEGEGGGRGRCGLYYGPACRGVWAAEEVSWWLVEEGR